MPPDPYAPLRIDVGAGNDDLTARLLFEERRTIEFFRRLKAMEERLTKVENLAAVLTGGF
jgi:hypothetical protein